MADTAVAQIAIPRKAPASTDSPIQSVLLTLIVPDHDSVAALLQKAS
ncbi:MAG TPA: hypothetical protein VIH91_11190 [Terriglobales bacterium]